MIGQRVNNNLILEKNLHKLQKTTLYENINIYKYGKIRV